MYRWERDKVIFVVFVKVKKGMAGLFDVHGVGEGGFGCSVAMQLSKKGL